MPRNVGYESCQFGALQFVSAGNSGQRKLDILLTRCLIDDSAIVKSLRRRTDELRLSVSHFVDNIIHEFLTEVALENEMKRCAIRNSVKKKASRNRKKLEMRNCANELPCRQTNVASSRSAGDSCDTNDAEMMKQFGLPASFVGDKNEDGITDASCNQSSGFPLDVVQAKFNSFWAQWGGQLVYLFWLKLYGPAIEEDMKNQIEKMVEPLCDHMKRFPECEVDFAFLCNELLDNYEHNVRFNELPGWDDVWRRHVAYLSNYCAHLFLDALNLKHTSQDPSCLCAANLNRIVDLRTPPFAYEEGGKALMKKKMKAIRRALSYRGLRFGSTSSADVDISLTVNAFPEGRTYLIKNYRSKKAGSQEKQSYLHLGRDVEPYNPVSDDKIYRFCWANNVGLKKYYLQRYHLFTRYEQGILMDEESWFSVTPEAIAVHIAKRCACNTIVDGFCGVGGNSIQFAKYCRRVIAIDIDPVKVKCARRNAEIYGVGDRIEFLCADFFAVAPHLKADVVFLSPPWGGPNYQQCSAFNVLEMDKMRDQSIFAAARMITKNVVYFVPRNSNLYDIFELAGNNELIEVEQNYLNGRLKTVTVYFGEIAQGHLVQQKRSRDADVK
uniref:Trimethylguanosine synthase n=1 Tax=Trichuris muris TaxID=70415 RepID=A0A5S6QEE2_TRIMR